MSQFHVEIPEFVELHKRWGLRDTVTYFPSLEDAKAAQARLLSAYKNTDVILYDGDKIISSERSFCQINYDWRKKNNCLYDGKL